MSRRRPHRAATGVLREALEAGEGLTGAIEARTADAVDDIDDDRLRRILGAPEHDTLAEAIAADAVDAAPVLGDLLEGVRHRNAEATGREYPDRPALVENALSDLPPPLATVGDLLVSQNTLNYLQAERQRR